MPLDNRVWTSVGVVLACGWCGGNSARVDQSNVGVVCACGVGVMCTCGLVWSGRDGACVNQSPVGVVDGALWTGVAWGWRCGVCGVDLWVGGVCVMLHVWKGMPWVW